MAALREMCYLFCDSDYLHCKQNVRFAVYLFSVLMSRFCKSTVIFFFTVLVAVAVSAFFLPARYMKRSMLSLEKTKLARLAATIGAGKRIVFVGGSNLSHGLDSAKVEEALGVTVVNMGLHGGLGFRYQLVSILNYVGEGDTVVLVPEYGNFSSDGYLGSAEVLGMVCDIIPEQKRILSFAQWRKMLQYVPRYGAGKLCRLDQCFRGKESPECKGDYTVYGDRVAPSAIKPLPQNKGLPSKTREDLSIKSFNDMNKLIGRMQSNGVHVLFMPPVFQHSSFANQELYIRAIADALKANGTPYIIEPSMLALPDNLFYDTPYHLNKLGYPIRTAIVIKALRPRL